MAPLAWIRRVASESPELTQIPLFGNSPPFEWSRFSLDHLSIHPGDQEVKDPKKNLGSDFVSIPVSIHPIGTVHWLMAREDISKLSSWLLNRSIPSELLQEGFYRYLVLQAVEKIQSMPPFETVTLKLSEEELPDEKAFCIDVEISHEQKSCWGRLVIPAEFKTAWIHHFSHMPSEYVPTALAKQTEITLSVKTGSVHLTQQEWATIRPGDFVFLDSGSYDAHERSGVALLSLKTMPLFNAKIKRNKIEILDYAFHHEEPMEKKEEEMVALKELPLSVTVEIARLSITLDKLMSLSPGNTLELPIHPDQGVSLTIQGQKVGRAELLHLGEKLGIRILEIG